MRTKTKMAITASLVAALLSMPIRISADEPLHNENSGPPQETALAWCVVGAAIMAVGAIYIISKKCAPKYYWLADDEQPPTTWVGTATDKECQINGWKKIGGPYDRLEDAPTNAPPVTNIVSRLNSFPVTITVQETTDMVNFTDVYSEHCDMEDFAYCPTNGSSGFFRLKIAP